MDNLSPKNEIAECKVNFLVPGFAKSGTTSLCDLLAQHPEIFVSEPKEPRFFCTARYESEMSWQDYNALFKNSNGAKAIGDGSVAYCVSHVRQLANPATVHSALPNAKLIFMVRDPIERLVSHWRMHVAMGWPGDVPEFDTAVRNYGMFLNSSRYWSHLSRWRRFYDDTSIHIMFFEDFKKSPTACLKTVFEFLDVNSEWVPADATRPRNVNEQTYADGYLMRKLRSSGIFGSVKNLAPAACRRLLVPFFKKGLATEVHWEESTLRWVKDELREDTKQFLEYADRPCSIWNSL